MRMRVPSCRMPDRGPLAALTLSLVLLLTGAVSQASAQTPFVPYFGKNNIHYDNFSGTSTRPTTSRSTTTRISRSISSGSPGMPKGRISRSAPI